MPVIRDTGVVLKRLDYSETSQVIVLLTRLHGKVRAIGKGVKRSTKTRFATAIDLLEVGHLVISSRQERSSKLATLTEWKQVRSLSGLREKLFRLHGGQYAAEITGHLTEDWDPHVELFDALVTALVELAEASEPLGPVVRYQLSLLESIGSLPRLTACVLCNRSEALTHFSSFEGGMLCRHCEPAQIEKHKVSTATARALVGWASPTVPVVVDEDGGQCPPCSPGARIPSRTRDSPSHGDEMEISSQLGISPPRTGVPPLGPFRVLNYHIAHLMGREPLLASKLVPSTKRRKYKRKSC